MITIKTKYLFLGIILGFTLTFLSGWGLGRFERDNASDNMIIAMNGVIRTYSYTISDLRKEASEKDAIIMSQRKAIREGLIAKEELRKLRIKHADDITKFTGTISLLLDSVQHSGTVVTKPCPPEGDDHPVLYLPLLFKEENEYLKLYGEFDEDGNLSLDIKMPLEIDVITGYDRTAKAYKTVVTYDQPYLSTIDIRSVKLDFQRPKRMGLSLIAGVGFNRQAQLQSVVGLGISYDLIQF